MPFLMVLMDHAAVKLSTSSEIKFMLKLVLEKAEEPEIKLPTFAG